MTGVPASAAGGPSGARGAAGGAPGGLPGSGRMAAREARDAAPGASGGGRARRSASDHGTGGSRAHGDETAPVTSSHDGADAEDGTRPARGGKIAAAAVDQASIWNIANLLTMLRLLLVPAFVMLMLANGGYDPMWRSFAWAAFAIAMITDLFDGHLARTYNLVTDFGKIADPIADKAIMGAALICLSALGDLPWWVTGVILGRELGITLLRFLVIRYGVIPASRGGKLKTLTQGVAVGMYVLALTGWLATLRWWVMAAAVVLTVATGLDYVKQAIVLRRRGIAERKAALEETEA
ncbi:MULTISPECIES: CDP-diacylglycerol--glycerol-3-phosphate 3-phosphatidyltransferase [unclassified Streptomyces]|uniref:CDP-diacylglycerol--glycerol-3-phosphate 3-phosphatidyltransferase n=1 Tax=unclassified Streptomyces TaxID=2593676 RepID=UPI000F6E7740|nr:MULTISPECIES: CDP-diacylglycerol--glycerol-3-phosphate 3-phosphatidyltransferase [unclassified Streptomyces]AZM59704.1 CDP-diacylglycerol--glycerol-3-phosphate 3-phosphatidyltransferase [Streptomyces sp. WAC 01438]RSM92128.1 CDP-diacylglycerol--glycerol-3-phosphate 3-phosphatidyltransferase [Streptomyces sp. WAC 01420]